MDVAESIEELSLLVEISTVAIEICRVLTHDDIANQTLHVPSKTLVVISFVGIQDVNRGLLLSHDDIR